MPRGSEFPAWDELHPVGRGQFMALADDLAQSYTLKLTGYLFRPFELYRSPVDQAKAFERKVSKARPWQSAHQYGLAVDFVPKISGRWQWPSASDPEWDFLAKCARNRGLLCEITWDRPHVEHPAYRDVAAALRVVRDVPAPFPPAEGARHAG